MAYSPIVNVAISINATPLTQVGFGTPMFICAHRQTSDRVIEVSNATELTSAPYNFPADHPAVLAAGQAFKQTPRVPTVKIGRRDMKAIVTPDNPADDATTVFRTTITVEGTSYPIESSVTDVSGNKTQEDVVDGFITAIGNISELTSVITAIKTGSSESAKLEISSTKKGDESSYFEVTFNEGFDNIDSVVYSEANVETPAETLEAITLIDVDWYFVAIDERSNDSYVEDMATQLGVFKPAHLFFYASADISNLLPYQAGNSDLFAKLKDGNEDRTVTFFHQDADEYVEMAYIGANAAYDAGSVTWANVQITGVGFSQDPSRNRPLTTSQKSNLMNKSANYIELDAGVPFTRTGSTAGGEWIDVIRGVDWQTADLGTSLRAVLLNQKGGKIPYTDQGTAIIREVISSSLQRGVNRQFLSEYEVHVPLVRDISQNDRLSRILTGVTFKGFLAGAIHEVTLNGEVTV